MLLLAQCTENPYRPCYRLGSLCPLQGLLQVENGDSEHFGENPAGDWGLAATGSGGIRAALSSALGKHFPGITEVALSPFSFPNWPAAAFSKLLRLTRGPRLLSSLFPCLPLE